MTRDDIIAAARAWLDVPFRKKGRSRSGIDCMGLLVMVAQRLGVPHIDYPDYFDWPDPHHRSIAEFNSQLIRLPPAGVLPGTIGLFAEVRLPGHTGIFSLRDGVVHVIHARVDIGVTEQAYRPQDRDLRLIGRWAMPGMED